MWIFGQYGTILIHTDNIEVILIDDGNTSKHIYVKTLTGNDVEIGRYNSEKETCEVMQNLLFALSNKDCVSFLMPQAKGEKDD